MKFPLHFFGIALAVSILGLGLKAHAAGARDPLTFQNAGLYGGTDATYIYSAQSPFDFIVLQAAVYEGQNHNAYTTYVQNMRQNGRRIIVDLIPQASDGSGGYYGVANHTGELTDAQMERLADVADDFLNQVGAENLYGITIGEEHIFWNGQREILNAMYDKIKARQDVPVFQWYSPASEGTAPGLAGWYNLKSDGWVSDEYFLDAPHMERNMRQYTVLQKPIVNTIFAGGEALTSMPFVQERFEGQVEIHQKYDIPMNYFTWSGVPGAGSGFSPYPNSDPSTRERFEQVLDAVNQAKITTPTPFSAWDTVPWQMPVIPLVLDSSGDNALYVERYAEDRIVRFVNDAAITGFSNLRWDSSPVELRPRQAGSAQASVAYTFENPGSLAYVYVSAPGFETAGKSAAVSMSVYDSDGSLIRTTELNSHGNMKIGVSGAELSGSHFKVVYNMAGTAAGPGDVLAGVESIEVDALIGNRPLYAFTEQFDFGDVQEQNKWTVQLGLGTGPQGPQFNSTTIHYNAPANAYEPLAASEIRIEPASAQASGKGDITLIRRVDAGDGETFTNPVFEADAHGYSGWGTLVQLWISRDGVNWDVASDPASAGYVDQHLVADATGVDGYRDLSSLWLKVRMYDIHAFGDPSVSYVHAWNFTLNGLTTSPVPEPSGISLIAMLSACILGKRRHVSFFSGKDVPR